MNPKNKYSMALTIGVSLLIGFLLGYISGFRYGTGLYRQNLSRIPPPSLQMEPPGMNLSAQAEEIIRELNCVCGCKMELSPCTCEEAKGAKEIKQLVQELIDQGLSKSKVIEQVVDKYSEDILMKKS